MIFIKKWRDSRNKPEVIDHIAEVEEILGHIPRTVIRHSLAYIFIVFMILLAGTYFFRMPEIVTGKILLTTSNPPADLISKMEGRIVSLEAHDGAGVQKNQLIAVLESATSFSDLRLIEYQLDSLTGDWQRDALRMHLPGKVMLGDLQNSYFQFYTVFEELRFVLNDASSDNKIAIHRDLILLKEQSLKELAGQADIKKNRYLINQKIFRRDSLLYSQGVISSHDYDVAFKSYLLEKENYLTFFSGLKDLRASILQIRQTIIELESTRSQRVQNLENLLVERHQLLKAQIENFREKHVFVAPVKGTLTFTRYWSKNQYLKQGERLATIVPDEPSEIHGRVILTSATVGRVEAGQKVNIKLSAFPYMRHGIIEGTVTNISLVPDTDGYIAEIRLKNGMTSKYEDNLKFVHEMDGVAEIVVEDVRLLERLIAPLRSLVVNQN